jgi:hypothetical protein
MGSKEDAVSSGQEVGVIFSALERTDRCLRLTVKELRESHPEVLDGPEFERLIKLTKRQLRENRALLGTEPAADKTSVG